MFPFLPPRYIEDNGMEMPSDQSLKPTAGGRVFAEAPAKRTGYHICRPVKKNWHATFHSRTSGRSAPPAVHKATDSALVLTIADPQKIIPKVE